MLEEARPLLRGGRAGLRAWCAHFASFQDAEVPLRWASLPIVQPRSRRRRWISIRSGRHRDSLGCILASLLLTSRDVSTVLWQMVA